jgi:hypothetical protein
MLVERLPQPKGDQVKVVTVTRFPPRLSFKRLLRGKNRASPFGCALIPHSFHLGNPSGYNRRNDIQLSPQRA